jgi:CheY-like chemotaxis protein
MGADILEIHRCKVLLVEDDFRSAEVAQSILEYLECDATVARSGAEAVGAVRQESFDLVLMDVGLPVMNGLDATRLIRAHEKALGLPPLYIVALTALTMPHELDECMASGMNEVMTKPFFIERLQRAILNAYRVARWPRRAMMPAVNPTAIGRSGWDGSGTTEAHIAC